MIAVGARAQIEDRGDGAEIECGVESGNSSSFKEGSQRSASASASVSTAIKNSPVWPEKCFRAVSATWEAVEK